MPSIQQKHQLKKLGLVALGLSAVQLLVACGSSEKAEPTTTEATSNPPAPKVEQTNAASTKMTIPFEIAVQAALEGHMETVIQALETGTDPNQINENGRTMLMMSSFNGHNVIADLLIKKGAKIDTQDMAGRTALMYASTGKNVPIVALLLENEANVNLVDNGEHWTPVMFAAAEGNKEVVELLLQNETDLSLVDIDGESAELFARNNGHIEVADLLKAASK